MQLNYGLNDDVSLWGLLWVVPVFRDLWAISNRPPDCSGLQWLTTIYKMPQNPLGRPAKPFRPMTTPHERVC